MVHQQHKEQKQQIVLSSGSTDDMKESDKNLWQDVIGDDDIVTKGKNENISPDEFIVEGEDDNDYHKDTLGYDDNNEEGGDEEYIDQINEIETKMNDNTGDTLR